MLLEFGHRAGALLADLIAPPRCGLCDTLTPRSPCEDCRSRLLGVPPPTEVAGVPVLGAHPYVEPVSGAVRRLKYEGRVDVLPTLVRLLVPRCADVPPALDPCLVPVPLHPLRLAERGFNQAALLARSVARAWRGQTGRPGWRVETGALHRTRPTGAQAQRGREARLAAMTAAFRVRDAGALAGRAVILCDDVFTTGATAAACIDVLRRAKVEVGAMLVVCVAGTERSG